MSYLFVSSFRNPTTNMYCSKCYKALQQRGQQPQQTSSSVAESTNVAQQITAPTSSIPQPQLQEPVSVDSSPSTSVQPDRKRCLVCSKKLGLTGLECKCGMMFCTAHRMPDSHNCTYDFKVFIMFWCSFPWCCGDICHIIGGDGDE